MTRVVRLVATAGALGLLGGCVAAGAPREPVAPTRPQPRPVVMNPNDPLLGHSAASLIASFGRPALDVREGPGRKLQFSGATCVLDLYLYARERGREPVSTHADARLPDGRDTDRAACAEALRRR